MFRADLLVPYGYQRQTVTLGWLRTWLLVHHHPEYVERLVAWLDDRDGQIGVGGGWRATQPTKPGFAPEGKSFHQDQTFADGFVGAAAVDLVARNGANVHRAPWWSEVPEQYSDEADEWGVHCNLEQGTANPEPWHMQPIEIDGWQRWVNAGRPAPAPAYPFPGRLPPTPDPIPPSPDEEDDIMYIQRDDEGRWRIGDGVIQTMYPADDDEVVVWAIRRAERAGRPLLTMDDQTMAVTPVTELAHVKKVGPRVIRSLGRGGAG